MLDWIINSFCLIDCCGVLRAVYVRPHSKDRSAFFSREGVEPDFPELRAMLFRLIIHTPFVTKYIQCLEKDAKIYILLGRRFFHAYWEPVLVKVLAALKLLSKKFKLIENRIHLTKKDLLKAVTRLRHC
jgi:hypothetical protein